MFIARTKVPAAHTATAQHFERTCEGSPAWLLVRRVFISASYSELSPGGTGNSTLALYGSGTR